MSAISLTRFRRCPLCQITYPAEPTYFHRDKSAAWGLDYRCKRCNTARSIAYGKANPNARQNRYAKWLANNPEGAHGHTRECTTCRSVYPATLEYFHQDKGGKWGLTARCKPCGRARAAAYQRANPETNKARYRRWIAANPERARAIYHKSVSNNRERNRALSRASDARRRQAINPSPDNTWTAEEVKQMYDDQRGLCAYCETPLFGTYHIEHMIPVSRGGANTWDNLAVSCPTCNIRKHNKTAEEFINGRQIASSRQ